jgi:hypothetical protein
MLEDMNGLASRAASETIDTESLVTTMHRPAQEAPCMGCLQFRPKKIVELIEGALEESSRFSPRFLRDVVIASVPRAFTRRSDQEIGHVMHDFGEHFGACLSRQQHGDERARKVQE